MKTTKRLFGTDGVRGTANRFPMTAEVALNLGRAISYYFNRQGKNQTIVIGKDTRRSGYLLEHALTAGICSMGGNVILVGPLPTAGIAYITQAMRADAGAMISASHNMFQDNGIKFFDPQGFKLPDSTEDELQELIDSGALHPEDVIGEKIGRAKRIEDATGRFVEFLKRSIPRKVTFDGLKLVCDAANGAAYKVAPMILTELGAEVAAIGVKPNGTNINKDCGSLHPEEMCKLVREQNATVGIALDGDADRLIMCDETGEVVDGDAILAIAATWMKKQGTLAHDTVVSTVMSNMGFDKAMHDNGIRVLRTHVGDRYVVQAMREGGFNLGGEQSGHMIFLDDGTTGDGVMSALQILSIIVQEGKPLSELKKVYTAFPQVLVNTKVRNKEPIEKMPTVAKAISAAEKELGQSGRILVRYSGTEMIARVMVEGEKQDQIQKLANTIVSEIQSVIGI
ncbi:MAG: phosphoglucosamine mutase [Deltaproteobacteria bacterium CG11_big_fil_rev_8_21_14_0_20_47_16]|nr:MAG: phosphoglucosamine mutase [Deltaproteobacteria bacterium CG11_big_fil_rev_8_21_14_0_20_47_16]